MKIYFKNSIKDSDKRVYMLSELLGKLEKRSDAGDTLSVFEHKHLNKLRRIFKPYDRHIPISDSAMAQWEKELPYHSSTYSEIFKGMIKMAKTCNKMQSEALTKIKAC